jgi:tetratricopeptide (TPR) repeat protein
LLCAFAAAIALAPNAVSASEDEPSSEVAEQKALAQYEAAKSHARRGEYTDAVHAFDEAIGMKPEPSDVARSKARRMAQNDLAWLLATCQDSTVRDGRRAVNLAEQLVASVPGNAIFLDTLGASYARNDLDPGVGVMGRVAQPSTHGYSA